MKIVRGLKSMPVLDGDTYVTIGMFDGVHLGHQKILRELKKMAGGKGRTVLFTFSPHPVKYLNPKGKFYEITTMKTRIALVGEFGLDYFVIEKFGGEISQLPPERFIDEVLLGKLRAKGVVVGYDFLFGKDRKGSTELLKELGEKKGFQVRVVEPVTFTGTIVSSTRIRELVLSGRVREAAFLLGREFFLTGKVIAGAGRGRELGFPTANIDVNEELLPLPGVYAVKARVRGNLEKGVANVGFNPTFGEKTLRVEIHLFDFRENIYGEEISVYFIDRIRDERKFSGADALVSQVMSDIVVAKKILESK